MPRYPKPCLAALAACLALAGPVAAERLARDTQSTPPPATTSPPSPMEDTGRNARDQSGATVTPEDQPETAADRKLAASIRRTVTKDKSLSLDAHNAKIIVRSGMVTLRGPVETAAEKDKLQSIAQRTRGVKQIDNQLEPKTP